ncbi:MAG: S9 family peptidase [Actinomycetota bacterium]|nr:S9 family peptidase [Actinomycetota bacterium]
MKPTDLPLLRSAGRPVLLPDRRVVVAVSHPDLDDDRSVSKLVLIDTDGSQRDFTGGPADTAPVLSPDGGTVVFGKAAESGPPQLYAIRVDGGEARKLTDHKLGASSPVFSPGGGTIAYLAAVPEAGRYGTDEKVTADAEPPRRFTALSYRSDGKGFVLDKPEQIFVIPVDFDPAAKDATPARATAEPRGAGKPAFLADGSALVYSRATGPDDVTSELVTVALPSGTGEAATQAAPQVLVTGLGDVDPPVVDGDTVYFGAVTFSGVDFPGRNVGLFSVPAGGGTPRRLTDEQTVDVRPAEPVAVGDRLLIQVQNRGAVDLRSVAKDAVNAALEQLPLVLGGQRVVKEFCVGAVDGTSRLAAVVGDPSSFAEVVTGELTEAGLTGELTVAGLTGERTVTDLGGELKKAGLAETIELSGAGKDGYPVHGWLLLPAGNGPHPVLLNVHGGPHSSYSWSLFDEAQVYAAAGYAVVMGNPRGSAGYGQHHGRAIVNGMGTVDVDDVLALLDVALQRDELDSARVGVMGGSYGGFMTSWLASHAADRFVAGISERAVNAWDSFSGASDIGHYFAAAYVGADRDVQWQASPLAYADAIDIPLLIIHSEHDWRCPLEQGQRLFTALKSRGAETEMLLFPAEGHELSRGGRPRHRQQRFDAILEWWQRHLPVEAPAPQE